MLLTWKMLFKREIISKPYLNVLMLNRCISESNVRLKSGKRNPDNLKNDRYEGGFRRPLISPSEDLLQLEEEYIFDWSLKAPRSKKPPKKAKRYKVNGEIIFGYHPVLLALQNKKREFFTIYLRKMKEESQRLAEIKRLASDQVIPVEEIDTCSLDYICQRPVHQGVAADVSSLESVEDDGSLLSICQNEDLNTVPLWVVTNNVHDPMNFGAILRSSYYFGVDKVIRSHSNCCTLTPIVSKASAGVMELMDIYTITDIKEFLMQRQKLGWQVVGTCSSKSSPLAQNVGSFHLERPTVLILGNEGRGIDVDIMDICDKFLFIPSFQDLHPEVDSLNVSVATGIILFQLLSRIKINR